MPDVHSEASSESPDLQVPLSTEAVVSVAKSVRADRPRVLILYNEPVLSKDHPDRASEEDVLYSASIIDTALKELGFPRQSYGVTRSVPELLARLEQRDFDIVFNLYEGNGDDCITEVYFVGLLEWLKIPFTGCTARTLTLAREKPLAKSLFQANKIRTPGFVVLDSPKLPRKRFQFPQMVKPAAQDASVGIDQGSVVTTRAELQARVQYVFDHYGGPVLVEQYIDGRELQISLLQLDDSQEPMVLPFSEIAFDRSEGRTTWPIYSYTAKWDEHSQEYLQAPVKVNVTVEPELQAKCVAVAKQAFRVLGARDLARVDTRVSAKGDVYVLELNPNPSITSIMLDEGLPSVGLNYNMFIEKLVLKRAPQITPPAPPQEETPADAPTNRGERRDGDV